jgi:tetratricopeptide (TPR) repeat protein
MKELELKKQAEKFDELNHPFSSASVWKKIIKTQPTAFNLLQYADQLRLSGNRIKAKKIIKKIEINDIPDDYKFVFHIKKGRIYQDEGKINKAIKSLKKSIKVGTEETYPYIFLATLLSKQSQLNKVEKILQKALNKQGDIDEVYYNLSTNYARKGDFKAAIEAMKACLNIDPNYSEAARSFLKDFENIQANF